MVSLLFSVLASALLVPAVICDTSFIRPPNFDRDVEDSSKNKRYENGSSITIEWETDLEEISLAYVQYLEEGRVHWVYLRENITATNYTWEAEYAPVGFTNNVDDVVGWFILNPPGSGDTIRASQRFNITAPKSGSVTATSTEAVSTSSAPSEEATPEVDPDSNSGSPTGPTAGIVVGALLGGLLVLGGIGL